MNFNENNPARTSTQFKNTEWEDPEKATEYLNQAVFIIQERPVLLSVLRTFYTQMFGMNQTRHVLDLGCGDGILGETLKRLDGRIQLSAWDGSRVMLKAAKARLHSWPDVKYRQIHFSELLECNLKPSFDFVVSSFAIHHASHDEKRALFAQIHQILKPGGFFVNLDTVRSDHALYDRFYDEIWRTWLRKQQEKWNLDPSILQLPEKAKAKPENKYEPLGVQLCFMEEVGFQDVECYYRQGLFAMYGGKK